MCKSVSLDSCWRIEVVLATFLTDASVKPAVGEMKEGKIASLS